MYWYILYVAKLELVAEDDKWPQWKPWYKDHNFKTEHVTANSCFHAQLGIRPSIVKKFHQIPTTGVPGVCNYEKLKRMNAQTDGWNGATPNAHLWRGYKKLLIVVLFIVLYKDWFDVKQNNVFNVIFVKLIHIHCIIFHKKFKRGHTSRIIVILRVYV